MDIGAAAKNQCWIICLLYAAAAAVADAQYGFSNELN